MSFFVVLRKNVRIPLYAVIEEASRSLPKTKFETAANYDVVAKRRTYVSKHRWIVISHAVECTQEDESSEYRVVIVAGVHSRQGRCTYFIRVCLGWSTARPKSFA